MRSANRLLAFAALAALPAAANQDVRTFDLTLQQAETRALQASNELKSYTSLTEAAHEQADSQFSALLPRLTFDANYRYITHVATITLPPPISASIPFALNNNYSFGPTLSYTLWDTNSARDQYKGLDLLAQARAEDEKAETLQVLLSVRNAYLRVQLANEELGLLKSSLDLSRAQNHDIESNYRAGAASRLDLVDSQRDVINYQLQYEQKKAEVISDLKDLFAITLITPPEDLISNVGALNLDPLEGSLQTAGNWRFYPPDAQQPMIKSQNLQAQGAERQASSAKDVLYPTIQATANASIIYPDAVVPQRVEQNTFTVAMSFPLFETDRSRHIAAMHLKEAEASRFSSQQIAINLERDYEKAIEQLKSLKDQRELSARDVQQSGESAKLYYQSYKAGKINLIDVQAANNRELTAKVNAARISANILTQYYILQSISGDSNGRATSSRTSQ